MTGYISWLHTKFLRRIKTRITENGSRDENIKKYFTPIPWADKTTTSERLSDKSFTLFRPFTGQHKKQLLYYFGETIKLGCKDDLQSQKLRQFFWSKTKPSNSANKIFLEMQSIKLFYETYQ